MLILICERFKLLNYCRKVAFLNCHLSNQLRYSSSSIIRREYFVSSFTKTTPKTSCQFNRRFFRVSNYCGKMDNTAIYSADKERYLKMSIKEKRLQYRCKDKYVTLESIPTWTQYAADLKTDVQNKETSYSKNKGLNDKISIFVGDVTALEIDAIVNAANKTLRGGGGVDGAIHRSAGRELLTECGTLNGCETGEAKVTGGYKLPAKYVIHTVGPVGELPELLENCYSNSLKVAKENGLRTIAFPCISTGVYHYPNKEAAHVALKTVREFLQENESNVHRIIFCLFLPVDVDVYETLLPYYFPV